MDWAEDLKMTFKKTVKKGRRATDHTSGNMSDSPSTPDHDAQLPSLDNQLSDGLSSGLDLKSFPKSKKRSGWTDEPTRSGSSNKNKNKPTQSELERFNVMSTSPPPVDEIPELPDFEDIFDEIAPIDVQETKAIAANRVETYKELNSELLKYSEIASSENIDLSKLMSCLLDEDILVDLDAPLTKEQLFNEVASIMREQQAKNDRDETVEADDN